MTARKALKAILPGHEGSDQMVISMISLVMVLTRMTRGPDRLYKPKPPWLWVSTPPKDSGCVTSTRELCGLCQFCAVLNFTEILSGDKLELAEF